MRSTSEAIMFVERRKRRSSDPIIALELWFGATARRSRVYGFMLTDANGFMIASNIPGKEVRQLAALVPRLLARGPDGRRLLDAYPIPLSVQRTGLGPSAGLLCVLGEAPYREAGLFEAAPGVRRILAERQAAAA
jgi:hypothetical protein